MRLLVGFAIGLLILSTGGKFIYLNQQKVSLQLYDAHTFQLSLWSVMFLAFFLGISLTWIYQFFSRPERFVQQAQRVFSASKDSRLQNRVQAFQKACLSQDPNQIRRAYTHLKKPDTSLDLRVQNLQHRRYQVGGKKLLENFAWFRQEYPGNLKVLLPYQQVAIEQKQWALLEDLSQEIQDLWHQHPAALQGMSLVHEHRQEWLQCVKQEQELIQQLPDTHATEILWDAHIEHLGYAIQKHHEFADEWDFSYLPAPYSDKKYYAEFMALGKAEHLVQEGNLEAAKQVLEQEYQRSKNPALLEKINQI